MKLYSELEVAYFENVTSDPLTNLNHGRVIWRTDTEQLKFYNLNTASWEIIPLQGGTASNNRFLTLPADTLANLELLTRVAGKLYYATDKGQPYIDDGTTLSLLGGGGGSGAGEINYIENSEFEDNLDGYEEYKDGSGAVPVDGTGASAGILNLTQETTITLRDLACLKIEKPNLINAIGAGIRYDFSIDRVDRNKLLKFQFAKQSDASYLDGYFKVWIYDVDNAALISHPDGHLVSFDDLTDPDTYLFSWLSTNSLNYRLLIHCTSTDTNPQIIYLDSFIIGPGSTSQGAAITRWQSYTPTNTNGFGTIVSRLQWRQNGSNVEIRGDFESGTTTAVQAQIELPNSYTINYLTATDPNSEQYVGWLGNDRTDGDLFPVIAQHGNTYLQFGRFSRTADRNDTNPENATNIAIATQRLTINVSVPVAEFANTGTVNLLTNDVIYANARFKAIKNTSPNMSNNGNITWDSAVYDTANGWNGTNQYNVPVTGWYEITASIRFDNPTDSFSNLVIEDELGNDLASNISDTNTLQITNVVTTTAYLEAGKGIRVRTIYSGALHAHDGNAERNRFEVNRLADFTSKDVTGFGLADADSAGLIQLNNNFVADENRPGLVPYYRTQTVAANNELSGDIHIVRVGDLVTLTMETLTHAAIDNPMTFDLLLPAFARPTNTVTNIYQSSGSVGAYRLTVSNTGQITIRYFNWSGTPVASLTSTGGAVSISYYKHP